MKLILGALTVAISATVTWTINELLDRPSLSFDVAAISIETRTAAKTIFRPSNDLHILWERVPWQYEEYDAHGMPMQVANEFEQKAARHISALESTKGFFNEAIERLDTVNDSYPDNELRTELLQGHIRLPGNYFWSLLLGSIDENSSLYSTLQKEDMYNKHPEAWANGPNAVVRFSEGGGIDLSATGRENQDLLRRIFIYMDRRLLNDLFDTAVKITDRHLQLAASFHKKLTEELSSVGNAYLVARLVVTNAGNQTDAVLGKSVVAIGAQNQHLLQLQAVTTGTLSPLALATVPGHETRVLEFISKEPLVAGTGDTQQGSLTLEVLKEVYRSELVPAKFIMTNARTDDYWYAESSFGRSAEEEEWTLLRKRAGT